MRPLYLKIENFKSYGEKDNQIDFRNIKVACIIGKNGNGKSSIAEAIAWALFGEFERIQTGKRGKVSETEYINSQKDYMQVEFEFEIGGIIYKVVRRLDRRGKKYLSLFIKKDDILIPISEASYTQTQNRLEKILGIDFNVFLHSAYLSQKRTEDFLLSSPEERREILAKILNLSVYDRINELAKEKRKEKKSLLDFKLKEKEEKLQIISEEDSIKKSILDLEEKSKLLKEQLELLQNDLSDLVLQRYEIEQKLKLLETKKKEKEEIEKKLASVRKKIEDSKKELLRIENELKNEAEITSKVREYENLKNTLEGLKKDYDTFLKLKSDILLVEKEISGKEDQKKIFEKSVKEATERLNGEKTELSKYEDELKKSEISICSIEKELEEIRAKKQEMELKREEITKLEKFLEVVDSKLKELATSYKLIDANKGKCPVCLRTISGEDEKEHIKREIASQGKEFKEKKEKLSAKLSDLKKEYKQLEEQVKQEEVLYAREKKLHGIYENLRAKIEQKKRNIEGLQDLISQNTANITVCNNQIQSLDLKLKELNDELDKLNFDEQYYNALLQRAKELEVYQSLLKTIEVNKVNADNLKKNISEYQKEEAELSNKIEDINKELSEMLSQVSGEKLAKVKLDISAYENKINKLQEHLNTVIKEMGIFEQRLNQIKESKEKLMAVEREIEEIKREIEIHDIIIEITGPDGIKNEIIANTLPLVRDEANRLLRLLTGGAFSIDFKTQREMASGKTIETLQIEISDVNGTRNYELFSGGELFRINFAIRIALAKVLLKRSGASIRMLILDEGFGSQDEEGKDHIIECLNQIKDQFDTILVITHIEDLVDAFDQRIVVKKDMEGSKIFVV